MNKQKIRRHPDAVRSVVLRMGEDFIVKLDKLCALNRRSRREVVEMLVDREHAEVKHNPRKRLAPNGITE